MQINEYILTIETHEGEMFSQPLSTDEARMLGMFAISMTPRKKVLKNFFYSVRNQPEEKFLHIQKWIENILKNSKTKFFTIQTDRLYIENGTKE